MNHKKSTQITLLLTLAVLVAGGAMLLYALAMPDSSLMRWLNDGVDKAIAQAKQLAQAASDRVALQWCQFQENQLVKAEIQDTIKQKNNFLILHLSCLNTLPREIGQLTQLKNLSIEGYSLLVLPSEIGQLTQLKNLYIERSQLTILPSEIGQLTQLKQLIVDNNRLTMLPPEIGQLTELECLNVSNNQLTVLPSEIGQLTHLKALIVRNNNLIVLPPEIGQLTHVNLLDVSRNQLTTLPPEIKALPYLIIVGFPKTTPISFPNITPTTGHGR